MIGVVRIPQTFVHQGAVEIPNGLHMEINNSKDLLAFKQPTEAIYLPKRLFSSKHCGE